MNNPSAFPIRVYYEDTDAGGVVYYANYLKFAERARTEALRAAGLTQLEMLEHEGIGFVVRHASIDYLKPARLDDLLHVTTQLEALGKASITLSQSILRDSLLLAKLEVKLVIVNRQFEPVKLDGKLRETLQAVFSQS
ncbi:MAG: tol-pal system-associated acyl-CoA thioesterase [Alphaproteobacteria bacterium]|nr:tol-pal system-associated acyl-CoA thioesterase [Alphaproteobacteria bacterium]